MRVAASLIALAMVLPGAESPYLKVHQKAEDGIIHLSAENVSDKPIVAYVVAVERKTDSGKATIVHSGVYTGEDQFAAQGTVSLGTLDTRSSSAAPSVIVDYVRLSDGTVWGDAVTEQGKEVAARFKK